MLDYSIRPAQISDAAEIARLVSEMGHPSSPAQMQTRLQSIFQNDSYATFVAILKPNGKNTASPDRFLAPSTSGGAVLGLIGTRTGFYYEGDGLYGQIMVLAVAGAYQRQGIGRALMEVAERDLSRRGVRTFLVNTANHRLGAHRFYEKLGYSFTHRSYRKRNR